MFIVPVPRRSAVRANGFDRLFDDAFDRFFTAPAADAAPVRRPALDISESEGAYVATLDVPGVAREDVKVSIDGRHVSVVAEARGAAPAAGAQGAGQAGEQPAASAASRFVLRERAVASYARSFTLPTEIDQAASQAKLDNGVLTLTLAKRQPASANLTVG